VIPPQPEAALLWRATVNTVPLLGTPRFQHLRNRIWIVIVFARESVFPIISRPCIGLRLPRRVFTFVLLKATEGSSFVDPRFASN
jgi:hypothetical protein